MIGHVAAKGFDVSVYDIDAGKRGAVEQRKAKWSADPASLAKASEAILICVGYDRELRDLLSPTGGLKDVATGTIVAVLSTVHRRRWSSSRQVREALSCTCSIPRYAAAARRRQCTLCPSSAATAVVEASAVAAAYSTDCPHVGWARRRSQGANKIMCIPHRDHEALALAQPRHGLEKLR